MFGTDIGIVLAYAAGIMIIFILAWLLIIPAKMIGKLIINALIGGFLLFMFNIFGSFFGIQIGINIVTALVVGFLGVPGLIAIVIIRVIL